MKVLLLGLTSTLVQNETTLVVVQNATEKTTY